MADERARLTPVTETVQARPREPSLGHKVAAAAREVVGDERASDLAALARLIDQVPELARTMRDALAPDPGSTVIGSVPKDNPGAVGTPRVMVAMLCAAVMGFVVVTGVGVFFELRDLRRETKAAELRLLERSAQAEAGIARMQGKHDAISSTAADHQKRLDAMELEAKDQRETIEVLTEHMLARLDAIGKRTGADKLSEWTSVPPELGLVVARRKMARRQNPG